MRRCLLFISVILSAVTALAGLRAPMNIPMALSANFGELRPGHFHSGIDLKTNQKIGQPVFSVADGYVSRINVSSTGYGKCLYVTHPSLGIISVYAHLDGFEPFIDSLLKVKQNERSSYAVDFELNSKSLPVKRGQRIATSGNSGSSGGPHLHFEIRDLANVALDPLKYFTVTDNITPKFHRVYITPVNGEGSIEGGDSALFDGFSPSELEKPINAFGRIGIGVRANDYMNGTANIYGVKSLKVEVDGKLKFHYSIDKVNFDSTRYINSFIDYYLYTQKKETVMKTYLPENNCKLFIKECDDGGYINITENRDYYVKLTISDPRGNTSVLDFVIRGDSTLAPMTYVYSGGRHFQWDRDNEIDDDGLLYKLPAGSLYSSIDFRYVVLPADTLAFSPVYQLHYYYVPLQKYADIMIKVCNDTLPNKKCYYIVSSKDGEEWEYEGGKYMNGYIACKSRSLGYYKILSDVKSPTVKYRGLNGDVISYTVKDSESGVDRAITGSIDGKIVPFFYDPKSNTVSYTFDQSSNKKGIKHKVVITVRDKCGNARSVTTNVTW